MASVKTGYKKKWLRRTQTLLRPLVFLLLAASVARTGPAANPPPEPRPFPFQDGEVLRYKLKWGFVRLATIELSQKALGASSPAAYEIQLKVKAIRLRSVLNPVSLASAVFVQEQSGERTRRMTCRYDPGRGVIAVEEEESGQAIVQKTVRFEGVYVDLVGLIMAMRSYSYPAGRISLPTFVGGALASTHLTFAADAQAIRIGMFPCDVRARRMRGETDWKALAGVSGPVEAWLSEDAAAVPLKIRLNSSLGRVTLELESVHRSDWPAASAGSPSGPTARGEVVRP